VMFAVGVTVLPSSLGILASYATRGVGVAVPVASLWDLGATIGVPLLAPIALVLLGALVYIVVRGHEPGDAVYGGIAVALSLAAAPYAWSYDYVPLALPWALTLTRAARIVGARRRVLIYGQTLVAAPLAWGLYLLAFSRGNETLSPLVPAASALLLALAVRWTSHRSVNAVSG
jgi:hypothetical protein